MGSSQDEMLEAAFAEMALASDALVRRQDELDAAVALLDEIADEPSDSEEQAADIARRLAIAEQDVERLTQLVAEADDELGRATENVQYYSGELDDEQDEDSGERLSLTDAAVIWLHNGQDEDYRFGYTEDELREAAES